MNSTHSVKLSKVGVVVRVEKWENVWRQVRFPALPSRSNIAELTIVQSPVELLTDIPMVALSPVSVEEVKLWVKRVGDAVGALLLLIILWPVFLVIAALIKLTSAGPVFFRQERLGLNRRPFMIWKFRTMVPQADKQEAELLQAHRGLFFKIPDDPRVTPLGRVLRKYSLDELPQLFNVLKGEMSLVGPRPIRDIELRRFQTWQQLRRFSMKPGLTCLWQINGRSNTSDEDRMRYDLEYVENWSLWLDIKIVLKTIPVVLRGDGAM
ncbi:MAG TPA: sugar transferase [Blastocatellia bacterium]|nr:sugar transferase [Blastocatellia bacterium]